MKIIKVKEKTIQMDEELYHFLHTKRYSNRRLWKRFLHNVCYYPIFLKMDRLYLPFAFNWSESPEGFTF